VDSFVNGDEVPSSYPIGIGREGLGTPTGVTKIVRKTEGPVWRPTARMLKEDPTLGEIVMPGPDNPLGTHALYLGWPQYAIHGTNKPFGIGRRVSSGCIRLYPESIVKLYEQIPVGTKVRVVNQPIKLAWIDNELFLEAHPDVEQAIQMEETGQITRQKLTDEDMKQIMKAAGEYRDRLHWAVIRTAIRDRSGYPVSIARRPAAPSEAKAQMEIETGEEAAAAGQEAIDEIYDGRDKETASYSVGAPANSTLNP